MKPGRCKIIALTLAVAGVLCGCAPAGAPGSLAVEEAALLADIPSETGGLPTRHRLDVPVILQNPELPNGCEATALAMVLTYHGYNADKLSIAYDYIPLEDFVLVDGRRTGGDPALVYPGDPGGTGYYCLPRVVAGAANRYLSRQSGASHVARNATGAEEDDLKAHIAAGQPVLAWCTIDGEAPRTNPDTAWYLSDTGELYEPYSNLHVVVLSGYDEESFYISDPQGLRDAVPIDAFMENYRQMGSRAVTMAKQA